MGLQGWGTARWRTAAAGLVVATALAACSGDGDSPAGSDGGSGGSANAAGRVSGQAGGQPGANGTSGSAAPGSAGATTPGASGSGSAAPGASSPGTAPAGSTGGGALTPEVTAKIGKTHLTEPETAAAKKGTWKGTQVAVLQQGDDATLMVKDAQGWNIVGGWWPSKGLPGPYLGGKRHVLALGSDARPGQSVERSRADTIQVVGVDGTGGGGILGMPRDSYVPLSTGGRGKINAAMVAGGPAAMTRTVAQTTGLPIQGYMLTSMTGLTAAVDAIGGIPVTLKRQVKDVPAGTHNLTGLQALHLARERKTLPGGDFDRSANQGLLLMSGLIKLRGQGVQGLPNIMNAISPHVWTNLTPTQVLTFMASAYQVNPMRVGRVVAHDGVGQAGAASIVNVGPKARAAFAQFRDGNL